jgi:Spy/CpxP family protein refolding chaperone
MLSGDPIQRIRDSFYRRNISEHEHLRRLRRDLVAELASENTNQARVDSLSSQIYQLQRDLQKSIIDYVDSLKAIVPPADRLLLQRWIVESFGERDQMHRGYRWRHGQDRHPEDRP